MKPKLTIDMSHLVPRPPAPPAVDSLAAMRAAVGRFHKHGFSAPSVLWLLPHLVAQLGELRGMRVEAGEGDMLSGIEVRELPADSKVAWIVEFADGRVYTSVHEERAREPFEPLGLDDEPGEDVG